MIKPGHSAFYFMAIFGLFVLILLSDVVAARILLDLDVGAYGDGCTKESIQIYQGQTTPLPNGIPTYTVQIENICMSGSCSISNIHINCGWFSTARNVNPELFRRIDYDDCLVNDGQPMNPGDCITFQYANTFRYTMDVSSVQC